jgi:2-aminoadipate transaminase
MRTLWANHFAERTQRMTSSAIRELLKVTEQPDVISFGGGFPAPEVFPVVEFAAACQKVLREMGARALQYGTTEGYAPLREMLAERAQQMGVPVCADQVLITSGSQQCLDLLGKILIDPGDRILIETPTYVGALQAWNAYQAEYEIVAADHDGMDPRALEKALRTGPKFIYALPNFQNPRGVTLSLARRQRLVELADHYGVPIVEDDPYGQLRFEGDPLPPLAALDAQYRGNGSAGGGNVVYLSTFSKLLSPGIRLAWVMAPPEVSRKLIQAKQGADLHTNTFCQMVAWEVSRDGFLDRHIELIRAVYRERRDAMLAAMEAHFPPGVHWTRPQGGLFLWSTLPEGMDTTQLLQAAIERKVAYVPGRAFYPYQGGDNALRLNFSYAAPSIIEEGIARLGRLIAEHLPAAHIDPFLGIDLARTRGLPR